MKVGDSVYITHDQRVVSGTVAAIDTEDPESPNYVVQVGRKLHYRSMESVHSTRGDAGCELISDLRRIRARYRKSLNEAAESIDKTDEALAAAIKQFK